MKTTPMMMMNAPRMRVIGSAKFTTRTSPAYSSLVTVSSTPWNVTG